MSASTLLLVALFVLRMWLLLMSPTGLSGDAFGYVGNAEFIARFHQLPPLNIQPHGFPLLLAPLSILAGDFLPQALLWVHCVMDGLTVLVLVLLTRDVFDSSSRKMMRTAILILILIQPFTATMVSSVYADHSSGFFIFFGIYSLYKALTSERNANLYAGIGGALLGFASIERADLLPVGLGLVSLLGAYGLNRHTGGKSNRTTFAVLAVAFLSVPTGMMIFQYHSSGDVGLIKVTSRHKVFGFQTYVRTWFSTESEYIRFAFNIGADGWEGFGISRYPARAFASDGEKAEVAELLKDWKENGYTAQIDAAFNGLARQKISANPLKHYAGIPMLRMMHYWLNVDGAQTLLRVIELKRPWSTAIVLAVLCVRLVLVFFCLLGIVALYRRFARKCGAETRIDILVLLAVTAVVIRTLTLGALSSSIEFGLMEYRYVSMMFPMLILVAIYGAYHCSASPLPLQIERTFKLFASCRRTTG